MIKLPDFSKCVDFQQLKEKMGVSVIPELPAVKFVRKVTRQEVVTEQNTKALEMEKKLQTESVTVSLKEIKVDEKGLLNIEGTKVVAYIRDQPKGIHYYDKYSEYKYHLCNCKALRQMRAAGRERRYLATKRKDGQFEVYDISGHRSRKLSLKLDLCFYCAKELKYRRLWFSPYSLKEYFERYDSQVPKTIRRIETVTETQTYSPNHDDISREYRKAVKFYCQKCGVNCSSDQSLLHLHHRDGDRSNYERTNLSVLCVICHSEQPMHQHLLNPQRTKEQVERVKSLRRDQGIIDLNISF